MHKPNTRFKNTRVLAFWREVDAALRHAGEAPAAFGDVSTLYACGYSVAQAVRALAPSVRLDRAY